MKLTKISQITGTIELLSGLHIGSGNTEIHIGGTDNPIIKNPVNRQPYIPGSSIKGKMRSLLEWHAGVIAQTNGKPIGYKDLKSLSAEQNVTAKEIIKLFGAAPEGSDIDIDLVKEIGPGRLSFWDCSLEQDWVKQMDEKNLMLTEIKMENTIDRISGTADNPRNTERVPAGARFEFKLSIRVHDNEELLEVVLQGLKLLELTGLGGSGSRGYGKLKFNQLQIDKSDLMERLENTRLQ
jgi:CRISPR-associated protein Csm3